jgi:predicted ferric reductase
MLTVFDLKHENHNVTSIFLRGDGMEKFSRRVAGQYAMLKLLLDGSWSQPHPFTISNSPQDDFLQMTIKSVGEFTTRIRSIPVGTEAMCDGPLGKFCKEFQTGDKAVFIAGGIGITPFLSVLRNLKKSERKPESLVLYWANNTAQDFFALDEIVMFAKELGVKIVLVQADKSVGTAMPLSTDELLSLEYGFLTKEIISKYSDMSGCKIYLCGPPPMIEYEKTELSGLNIDSSRIEMEKIIIPKKKEQQKPV